MNDLSKTFDAFLCHKDVVSINGLNFSFPFSAVFMFIYNFSVSNTFIHCHLQIFLQFVDFSSVFTLASIHKL